MMYAVWIEIDKGEYTYVKKGTVWAWDTPVKTFKSKEDAEREASKWNSGKVVEYK